MRTLMVVTLLVLAGCAAPAGRSYEASNSSIANTSVSDRTHTQASASKIGEPVKSGTAATTDPMARPGRR